MLYEFNWYLVVKDENLIQSVGEGLFQTTKQGPRIYPLESELPLITKNNGCIGTAVIKEITLTETQTTVKFEIPHKYEPNDVIAKHYFDNYKKLHV